MRCRPHRELLCGLIASHLGWASTMMSSCFVHTLPSTGRPNLSHGFDPWLAASMALVLAFAILGRDLVVRMADAIVPHEGVGPAERLLLDADLAKQLLLFGIVNCPFMPGEIVGARENSVAWVAGAWVDTFAAVGSTLAVHQGRRHARRNALGPSSATASVSFLLVLLQQLGRVEATRTPVIGARVGTAAGVG